ncbi:MAG TPA: C4-dicarboxylate ABC transporter permease, partial [Rhodobacteraceae bacterium]|nr:C4-dicarboxylate ABC transporter permease [Paracoccaceae bacterium]
LPARRGGERGGVPLIDLGLALLSMITMAYVAGRYPDLVLKIFSRPLEVWLPGLIALALTLEALRRAT